MRHFGRADAKRIGAERAMGRGVAVAADDQESRQRQPLLGPDHMDDALARIVEAEQRYAMLLAVFSSTCRTIRAISGLAMLWREPRVGT